jgi:integrase
MKQIKNLKNEKRYLTDHEVEDLKDACETSEDRAIIRDLTDTGMRLEEVLKKRAGGEVMR